MKKVNKIALIAILSIITVNVLCPILTFAKDIEKNTEDNNYYSKEIIDNELYKDDDDNQNSENRDFSESYKEYLKLSDEEKEKIEAIPRKYDVSIDEFLKKTEDKKKINIKEETPKKNLATVSTNDELPASFDLRNKIDVQVENQGNYGLCWDFASTKSLETYLSINENANQDFSELHADYMESNEFGGKRALHEGGTFSTYIDYLSKYGPVMEEDVPYHAVYGKDDYYYLRGLEKEAYVGDIIEFPTINKEYDNDFNITYYNDDEEISEDTVQNIRNKIKKHIMENGGLYTSIVGPSWSAIVQNGKTYEVWDKESNIMCMRARTTPDHAVTIIGWDDNFSADNYTREQKPKNNGAYIALNSWGNDWGDNGVFYISYEDRYVERELCGIIEASTTDEKVAYKKLHFEDKNLYDALKDVLSNQIESYDDSSLTLYANKLYISTITELDLSNRGIKNINGLEIFNGLHVLDLNNNEIENIDCLSQIDDLWSIYLNNNKIKNIDVLSSFYNIYNIEANNNKIEKINFSLESFDWIDEISLAGNDIKDMSDFFNIKNKDLEYAIMLDLSGNKNLDLSTIDLTKTYTLELRDCGLETIELDVSDETILTELDLSNNNITDLSCIPEIISLELNLSNNGIQDASSLPYLNFDILNLSENKDIDLKSLANIKAMEIDLENCNIDNIKIMELPNNYYRINLANNPVSDLKFLEDKNVTYLNINYTNIENLEKLYDYAPNLYKLCASGIKDITGIERFKYLREIDLNDCGLTNINFLSRMTDLYYLSLNNNEIEDISILADKDNLCYLYIANNRISNIDALYGIDTKSFYADLSNNRIADSTGIKMGPSFILNLNNQKIEDNIEISATKEYVTDLPDIIKSIYYRMLQEKTDVELNNCEINYINKTFTIYPVRKGEGSASVKILGGIYDGSEYTINYKIINDFKLTDIEYEYIGKGEFEDGENFDKDNLKVYALYEDGFREEINDYETENFENLTTDQTEVKIKYDNIEKIISIKVIPVKIIKFNDENVYNEVKKEFENNNMEITFNDTDYTIQANIKDIEEIKELKIDGITKDLIGLSELKSLKKLTLVDYENDDLSEILNLKNLETIELETSSVNDITQLNEHTKLKNIILGNTNVESIKDLNDSFIIKINHKYEEGSLKIEDGIIYLPDYLSEIYDKRTNPNFSTLFNSKVNRLEDGKFCIEIDIDEIKKIDSEEITEIITLNDDEGDEITVVYSYKLDDLLEKLDVLEFEDKILYNKIIEVLRENGLEYYLVMQNESENKIIIKKGFIENIEFLSLDLDGVKNISGLSGFTNLNKLFLNNTNIDNLSELQKINNLEELLIYRSNIESISQIGIIPNLKKLNLRYTNINSIKELYNNMNLDEFFINDFYDINNSYDINKLNVNENKIYLPEYFSELMELIDEPIISVQYIYNIDSNFIEVAEDGEIKTDENGKYYVELLNDISRKHIPSSRQIDIIIHDEDSSIRSHFTIEYVAEKNEEDGYILGYDVDDNRSLINVQPKTPIDEFKRIFTGFDNIQVLINNEEEMEQKYAYTGMKVTLLDNNGEIIIDENNNPIIYTLAVKGDINGDGLADGIDSLLLKAIRTEIPVDDVCDEGYEAADINRDGKINYLDSRYLLLHRAEVENYNLNFVYK